MAFIEGKQTMDAILVANECVDTRVIDGITEVLRNLDIEKAYMITSTGPTYGRLWKKGDLAGDG